MYQVGFFLFNDLELLDFAGPFEVFSVTSELNHNELFNAFTVSQDGGAIRTVNGVKILPDFAFDKHPAIDILVIPGGVGTKSEMEKDEVLAWVAKHYYNAQITCSVCSGARILAQLGLLDGIPSTTHHEVIEEIRAIAPKATVLKDERYVDQGKIMTSAGISAGIDLSLHVVEALYGKRYADRTAVYMEYGDWKSLEE
jgi:transcriptional regulator GlxA family with amidase domain